MQRETVPAYLSRIGSRARYRTIHPEAVASNPLPANVVAREALPADRGWWGYSFHDVPTRTSGETFTATIPDCRILWYRDPSKANDFFPAIVTADDRSLDMRELRVRPMHEEALRGTPPFTRLAKATWIIERVYHNHSHWLTAHLPKLLLLKQLGSLDDVLLPRDRTPAMDDSLRLIGLDPSAFPQFDPERFLHVDELTVLGTDRFRPELLRLVPEACRVLDGPPPHRRVFISRSRAARRRLLNEEALWPLLAADGFERVHLEELPFDEQVSLMRQTSVLLAPHGAGLTNMLFCPPGADVIEIADLGFPNPNFYALAAALGHRYWLIPGEAHGNCHPLEKDLSVEAAAVQQVLRRQAR
ncbi:MAG: glycosyltransferase family 61 protein [Acidobacteria bacterium]|nr:glycosyltransferase family 61 protein [Acidobacteriota bacterium]